MTAESLYHIRQSKSNEILATFAKNRYTDCREFPGRRPREERKAEVMDFFEKVTDTVTAKGREAADKAREMAEIARLKSQIASCEEVIKKNYLEIGRLFMEQYKDAQDAPFEKQRRAILNAQAGVEDLQKKIRRIKGL